MQTNWSRKAVSTFVKSAMMAGVGGSILTPNKVLSSPQGGVISQGSGSIQVENKTTTVNQLSGSMVVDWQSFNVAADELVRFEHPSATSATLNRIHDQNVSQIMGRIEGQGKVFLVNPNGIVFGQGATVDLGSLVATTKQVTDADFMSGNYQFNGDGSEGHIVNRGTLNAATGGAVVLLADTVVNEGVIQATKGTVVLASGESATLDFEGDGLLQFKVTDETQFGSGTAVENAGLIQASDGRVLLTAKTARDVFSNVVNNTGVIEATGVDTSGGTIRLLGEGGDVRNSGQLLAKSSAANGGSIDLSGDRVAVGQGSVVDASGATGGGTIRIGGGYQGLDQDLTNAKHTLVSGTAKIKADATDTGKGGKVVIWADESTNFQGSISAKGSADGAGGFAEVSGKEYLNFNGEVDLTAESGQNGTLLLDPKNIRIRATGGSPVLDNDEFAENANGTSNINASDLVAQLDLANVILQATNDITVETDIDASGNAGNVATTNNLTFEAQDDIEIDGEIRLKNGATLSLNATDEITQSEAIFVSNLELAAANASLNHASNDIASLSVTAGSGNISLNNANQIDLQASSMTGNLTLSTSGNITQNGALDVDGTADLNANGAGITLENAANDFGSLKVNAGNASVVDANQVSLAASTVTGNLTLSTTGNITQSGALDVDGAADLNANGADITLENAANDFGSLKVNAGNASITDANQVVLAASTVTGNLTLSTTGDITQSGALDVDGTVDLSSNGGDINLTNVSNDFGTLKVNAANAELVDANQLSLNTSNLTGDLTLTTTGQITQVGAIDVDGITELASNGAAITLENASNDFASLRLNGSSASIVDRNQLVVGTSQLTGDLSLTTNGDISQNGVLDVDGKTTLNSNGGDITLENASNDFATIQLVAANASVVDANQIVLDTSNLTGDLSVQSSGNQSQLGALSVSGVASFNAGSADISLQNAANDFSTLSLTGGSASVTDSNQIVLGSSDLAGSLTLSSGGNVSQSAGVVVDGATQINAAGYSVNLQHASNDFNTFSANATSVHLNDVNNLNMAGVTVDELTVSATGALTQTGAFVVANNTVISSSSANLTQNNDFNSLSLSGGSATVTDINGLSLGNSNLSGNLTLTVAGDLGQTAAVIVNGSTSVDATGHVVDLQNSGNDFTSFSVLGSELLIRDANNIELAGLSVSSLLVNVVGALTQTGAFDVSGDSTVIAANSTLTQANDFNRLSVTGGTAEITDINDLQLSASDLTGNFTANVTGALTQNGAVDVDGAAVLNAATVTLAAANDFSDLNINGGSATITDRSGVNLSGNLTGNLSVTTAGAINQSSALQVAGTTTLDASGHTIDLQHAANDFNSVNATAAVLRLRDANDLVMSALTVNDLLLNTAGTLTQTGAFIVSNLATISSGNAQLTQANDFNELSVNGTAATVNDIDDLQFTTSLLTGDLTVDASGNISQSGTITVGGHTQLNNTGNDIDLQMAGNDLNTLSVLANNLYLADTNDLSMSATNVTDLRLNVAGHLTQSGVFEVTNHADITAGTMLLDQANLFNTLAIQAGNTSINEADGVTLSASTVTGDLALTVAGDIFQNGSLSVAGAAALTATGNDIVLQNAGNDFATLSATANELSITDVNDLTTSGLTLNNLNLAVGGTLNQTGAYTISNHANISAANANLNQANDFNTLSINGGSASVNDVNTLSLSQSSLTGSVAFQLGGNLTQTGNLAANSVDINASGYDVVLDQSGNEIGTLALVAEQVSVVDSDGLILANSNIAQRLDLTTGGAVTQTAALNVADLTINAVGNSVTLTNAGNDFDNLAITAAVADITDLDGVTLQSANVTNRFDLDLSGTLNQADPLAINQFNIAADGQTVTLDNAANDFNTISIAAAQATVTDANGLSLGQSTLLNNLTLNTGGDISQSSILILPNLFLNVSGHSVSLSNALNQVANVEGAADQIVLNGSTDLELGNIQAQELSVGITGDLTQKAGSALNVSSRFSADAGSITLTENNLLSLIELSGNGNASLHNSQNLLLGNTDLANLTLNVTGDISNTTAVNIDISGDLVATNTGDIDLGNIAGDSVTIGALTLNSGNVSIGQNSDIQLKDTTVSSLTLNGSGNVTDQGDLNISGLLTVDALGDIELGTIGASEETRFGAISLKAANIRVVEEDAIMINRAEGDVVELISEAGGIGTDGTQIVAGSALTLRAGAGHDIGSPANLVDLTLDVTGALTLDARNAYLTQSAADFSKQVALFSSNALIRSEANLAALTRSEVQFLTYLLGVDDALFNEFVTIFDVQDEGMLLPEDQREEELSFMSDDGRYLVSIDKSGSFNHYYRLWEKYGDIFSYVSVNHSEHRGWM